MNEHLVILVLSLLITGYLYFTFEVVLPYADARIYREKACVEKGGVIVEQSNSPDLCIKREHIIKK